MRTKFFKIGIVLVLFIGINSCGVKTVKDVPPNFQPFFEDYGVKGCFLIYDMKNDIYQIYNSSRCEQGFLPASTFKILNSLIGLETGVITDENMVIPWNGVASSVEEWNRDHTMASAIQ